MTERPLIVVYGNCQAEVLHATLASTAAITRDFDLEYVRNFHIAGVPPSAVSDEDLGRTAYLFEQAAATVRFEQAADLPSSTTKQTFMSLDFNPMWPLHAGDARSMPEMPDFPFGRFPYGDRAINSVVADGLSGDEGYEAYTERSAAMLHNIDRVLDIEKSRWALVEQISGVSFLDWVLANFSTKRLFHTYNHPSLLTMAMMVGMVAERSGLLAGDAESIAQEALQHIHFCWKPETYEAPIHPIVAETYGLEWWSPDMIYNWGGHRADREELIRAQIDWRLPDRSPQPPV